MTDVHSIKQRSYNMSRIKGKNTKPEITLRKKLHALGYRFSLHSKKLPGKPDIVLRKYNTVIFVNGCFWHGHKDCKYFKLPKSNVKFWSDKISANIERDKIKFQQLIDLGWHVITIWECELKTSNVDKNISKLIDQLKQNKYICR